MLFLVYKDNKIPWHTTPWVWQLHTYVLKQACAKPCKNKWESLCSGLERVKFYHVIILSLSFITNNLFLKSVLFISLTIFVDSSTFPWYKIVHACINYCFIELSKWYKYLPCKLESSIKVSPFRRHFRCCVSRVVRLGASYTRSGGHRDREEAAVV